MPQARNCRSIYSGNKKEKEEVKKKEREVEEF